MHGRMLCSIVHRLIGPVMTMHPLIVKVLDGRVGQLSRVGADAGEMMDAVPQIEQLGLGEVALDKLPDHFDHGRAAKDSS